MRIEQEGLKKEGGLASAFVRTAPEGIQECPRVRWGDASMHQVQLNTFGDVASFVSIIGGLLGITYFMVRNVILERPAIRRLFQLTCLCAGMFAFTVVVGFLQPYRPPPEWLVNAGVASMLGALIAWGSCTLAVVVSLFRKA